MTENKITGCDQQMFEPGIVRYTPRKPTPIPIREQIMEFAPLAAFVVIFVAMGLWSGEWGAVIFLAIYFGGLIGIGGMR